MHAFLQCLSSQNYFAKLGNHRRKSTFFGYWIKFLLILFEEHPFIWLLKGKRYFETKNRTLRCLKRHYSTVQSMKNVAVDGGRGIFPLFSSLPRGIWQLKSPLHPQEFAIQVPKKCKCPGVSPDGGERGGGWAQLELTDALSSLMYSITVLCNTLSFCPLVILCFSDGFSPTEWVSTYSLEIEVRSSNNDNACLISSFLLIAHWTFLFFCDILYYTSNQFSEKEMFSLFCVQTLFQRFLVRILIGRSPFCQTSPLILSSSISS